MFKPALKTILITILAIVFTLAAVTAAFACCIDVEYYCTDASGPGLPILYEGFVYNCGGTTLTVDVFDPGTGQYLYEGQVLPAGQSLPISHYVIPQICGSTTNTIQAIGVYSTTIVSDTATATCDQPCDGGGDQGCTPGYWKNHLDKWAATGYNPYDSFDVIFGVSGSGFATLLDAVNARGNSYNSLVRHAAAGLLNASSPSVDYPMSVAQVIAAFQAGDKTALQEANESFCPF